MPAKTFTPGQVVDAQDTTMEEQGPKVVAPTPEQITAIKVLLQAVQITILFSYCIKKMIVAMASTGLLVCS